MIPAPPPATSASTATATTSSGGGAVRLARLGHPYPGLEAFAAVGLRHGIRCGKNMLTGSPGVNRGCAVRNWARLGSSHDTCDEPIGWNHDSGQRRATVREMRAAFESNGADRFDRVRTPPVETTHRRGGPGRATSANGRGRGSAGMGKRTMREKALNAGERAVHWAREDAIRYRGDGEWDALGATTRGGSSAGCGVRMGGALGGEMVHLKPPSPETDFLSGFVAENVQEGVERYTPPGGVARMHACDRAETCTQPWSMSLSKLRSLIVCSCKGRCTECLEM